MIATLQDPAVRPLIDRVLALSGAEKHVVLEALLKDWASSPSAVPPLPWPETQGPPVQKVYTAEEVEELQRRIDEDDSITLEEMFARIEATPAAPHSAPR